MCLRAALFLLPLLLCACVTPTLTVRHMDPTQPVAHVWLDGARVGTVQYGKEVQVPFSPGRHTLSATTPMSRTNAWSLDGDVWRALLERDATLTLLTPRRRRRESKP